MTRLKVDMVKDETTKKEKVYIDMQYEEGQVAEIAEIAAAVDVVIHEVYNKLKTKRDKQVFKMLLTLGNEFIFEEPKAMNDKMDEIMIKTLLETLLK